MAPLSVPSTTDLRRRLEERRHLVVQQGARAVVRVDGIVTAVHAPGRHPLPKVGPSRLRVDVVDVRRQLMFVQGQEVPAADTPGVRLSAWVRYRVVGPVVHLDEAISPLDDLRLAVQLALRDWAAERTLDAVLEDRAGMVELLTEAVRSRIDGLGLDVFEVGVRDTGVPGDIKEALADQRLAEYQARSALTRARGEVSATRALANVGRLYRDYPGLQTLRLAQIAAERYGSRFILNVGPPSSPEGTVLTEASKTDPGTYDPVPDEEFT